MALPSIHAMAPGPFAQGLLQKEKYAMNNFKASVGIVINGMGLLILLAHLGQWYAG